jgi:signal transduction histidine kinase
MRINLQTKIWSTVLVIVLIFAFFILYYFPERQENYLLGNYNNEVQNLANIVAVGVEIAINEQNFMGIRKEMEIVKNDPRLSFVRLLEEDTLWNKARTKYEIQDTVINTFPENAILPTNVQSSDSLIVKRASLNTKLINGNGAILVGFKTQPILEMQKRVRFISFIVSAVVMIIAILIGLWLARNISRPVLALREAAHCVGEGDLTQQVKNNSGDEIGELTRAFNTMVKDLAQARQALNEANQNLASTNKALSLSMDELKSAQEQLIQAEKMASLGQLTAGVAHEINNPINFVSANVDPLKQDLTDIILVLRKYEQVVREQKLEDQFSGVAKFKEDSGVEMSIDEVKNLLKGIEDGAKRTAEIVKGLRNFSRLDQNVFKKADLNDGIDSTLTLLHSSYKNRIEIDKEFGDLPEVECFPGQLNQVFLNILSNAIQAIPEQGKIAIKTWVSGDRVKISFKDNGSGMSEEVRKKIYDPFFTTKDIGKGNGLGLYISYGILEKHRGKIEVFSTLGKGTEFVLTIPIQQTLTA